MASRTTITISADLKERLSALKGDRTWEEFLSDLLRASLDSKIERLEVFLRETADNRDLPFERVRLRLGGGDEGVEAGDGGHRRPDRR